MTPPGVLDRRDPTVVARAVPALGAATAWFRPEVRGLEHVPDAGPVLLVGNHSGGYYMPDVWAFLVAFVRQFGPRRELFLLGSDVPFHLPGFRGAAARLGIVPACHRNAEAALERGAAVLVYPGGDWDDCRSWRDRHRVELAHHTGFVRVALRARVPVVPVVSHGSHETVVVLTRGERLARALRLDRLRIKVCPIVLGLPFGVASIVVPYVPLPAKVTVEALPALAWDGLGDVERCYAEVVALMQAALDRLAQHPALPLLDRPPRI